MIERIIVENYNGKKSGEHYRMTCPSCGNPHRKCYASIEKDVLYCFHCGYGSKTKLSIAFRNLGWNVATSKKHTPQLNLFPVNRPMEDRDLVIEPPDGFIPYRYTDAKQMAKIDNYFGERYVPLDLLDRFEIGYCQYRLIIPVVNGDGNWVYYTGRALPPLYTPKYMSSKIPKPSYLYGSYEAATYFGYQDELIITEAAATVMRLFSMGKPAVALLGKQITDSQLVALKALPFSKYVLLLDKDAAELAVSLARDLSKPVRGIFHLSDPADVDNAQLFNCISLAEPVTRASALVQMVSCL